MIRPRLLRTTLTVALLPGAASRSASASLQPARGFASRAGPGARARATIDPPIAKRVPKEVVFGKVDGEDRGPNPMEPKRVVDDLFWLRDDDRKSEDVLAYLRAENEYTENFTAPTADFKSALYKELLGHVQETDMDAPYPWGAFEYYTRTVEGLSYTIHCRKPRGAAAREGEQVLLDENEGAKAHKHYSTGAIAPSPSHNLLAYAVDTNGYETYKISFKDLRTGEPLADVLEDADSSAVWAADDSALYYTKMDAAHRPYQLWRHVLGTAQSEDELLYTEKDELFWLAIGKSDSGKYLWAETASTETAEVHAIDLSKGKGAAPVCVAPRKFGVVYSVIDRGDSLLVLTNKDDQKNFALLAAPAALPSAPSSWAPLAGFEYDSNRTIAGVKAFKDHVAVFGREDGQTQAWVLSMPAEAATVAKAERLSFEEASFEVYGGANYEYDDKELRIVFSSMVTPPTTLTHDMASGARKTLKVKPVPNYDASKYATERLHATAADGTQIPISLVYRKDLKKDGAPCMLYGYGSYGINMEPSFSASRLPLLDRGMCYAIAHIRGGGEMGRERWYEKEGKYLTKRNTFTDFVDCAKHLHDARITTPERTAINGRSAGGLLMGAVLNMAPERFAVAVAGVPFVDVMVSMCDPSIPLTVGEWEEWGNPNEEKYYEYMKSYSPMENVGKLAYPAILVTAGLYDPRVAYWEPAKWVARLRAMSTSDAPTLLKMDLDSGHFSASDRYKYLEQLAFEYAFVLDQLGLREDAQTC